MGEYREAVTKSLLAKKATALTVADGWGCSGWQLASCVVYTQIILKYKIAVSLRSPSPSKMTLAADELFYNFPSE